MKKLLVIGAFLTLLLTGCGESHTYGYMDIDWESFNETHEDYHVYYASSDSGCYTDGSYFSNDMAKFWMAKHNEY